MASYSIEFPDGFEPGDGEQIKCWWKPQPNITAFELALLLPYLLDQALLARGLTESDWSGLGEAARHFERLKPE